MRTPHLWGNFPTCASSFRSRPGPRSGRVLTHCWPGDLLITPGARWRDAVAGSGNPLRLVCRELARNFAPAPHHRAHCTGRLVLFTGAVVALAGGALAGFGGEGAVALSVRLIWLLGVALLAVGACWPGGVVEYAQPDYRWEKDRHGGFVQVATRDSDAVRAPAPAHGLPLAAGHLCRCSLAAPVEPG